MAAILVLTLVCGTDLFEALQSAGLRDEPVLKLQGVLELVLASADFFVGYILARAIAP